MINFFYCEISHSELGSESKHKFPGKIPRAWGKSAGIEMFLTSLPVVYLLGINESSATYVTITHTS